MEDRRNNSFRINPVLVGAAGLEPATTCLEGRCSIHLSYAPVERVYLKTERGESGEAPTRTDTQLVYTLTHQGKQGNPCLTPKDNARD
jgi:hypothetical protein